MRLRKTHLPRGVAEALWLNASAVNANPFVDSEIEDFLTQASRVAAAFPPEVHEDLYRLRIATGEVRAILVRGLLSGSERDSSPHHRGRGSHASGPFQAEAILAATVLAVGIPICFASQHDGYLVQDVTPVSGGEDSQASYGSQVFLNWHVEEAFLDKRPDLVALLCRRSGQQEAATLIAFPEDIDLPPWAREELLTSHFTFHPDAAHSGSVLAPVQRPVIEADHIGSSFRFDSAFMAVAGKRDGRAARAHGVLERRIQRNAVEIWPMRGDLLLFDNKRVVHARSAFTPSLDGTDRWLQRMTAWRCRVPEVQGSPAWVRV